MEALNGSPKVLRLNTLANGNLLILQLSNAVEGFELR